MSYEISKIQEKELDRCSIELKKIIIESDKNNHRRLIHNRFKSLSDIVMDINWVSHNNGGILRPLHSLTTRK